MSILASKREARRVKEAMVAGLAVLGAATKFSLHKSVLQRHSLIVSALDFLHLLVLSPFTAS